MNERERKMEKKIKKRKMIVSSRGVPREGFDFVIQHWARTRYIWAESRARIRFVLATGGAEQVNR